MSKIKIPSFKMKIHGYIDKSIQQHLVDSAFTEMYCIRRLMSHAVRHDYRNGHHCYCRCFTSHKKNSRLEKRLFLIQPFRSVSTFDVEKEVMKSYVKDLYAAKINMEWIYPFPTFDTNKELNEFVTQIKAITESLAGKIDSMKLDREGVIKPELLQGLKKLKLFGMKLPGDLGGLGLTNLKFMMLNEEIAALDLSVQVTLAAHNLLGVQPVLDYGNDEQKKKYLSNMASGDLITAFCLNETSSGSDITMIKTCATLNEDGSEWSITGEKTGVINGGCADLMIVFAKTEVIDVDKTRKDTITAFIVEKEFGGVLTGPQEEKMGMRSLNTCDVYFDETPVPAANLLGEVGDGFRIATETMNSGRLGMAVGLIGQMKNLFTAAAEQASFRKQFGKPLRDFRLTQEKIFKMSQAVYATESVAYLTAGKMDQALEEDKVSDLSVECAISKILCSEHAWQTASECLQIIGYKGYTSSLPYERILRDCRFFLISEGTNEVLRLYVALSGAQHALHGLMYRVRRAKDGSLREKLTALKDRLDDELGRNQRGRGYFAKKIPSFGLTAKSQTKSWLDPCLEECGHLLEDTVQLFHQRVYYVLKHFGKLINQEQILLRRLADVGINLFAMSAVLSRCNKSLILGLRDRDHDRMLAEAFIWSTYRNCSHILEELLPNYNMNVDWEAKRVGTEMLEARRYTCAHPLELEHRYVEHPKYIEQLQNLRLEK